MLTGINIDATVKLARALSIPVIASGGLAGIADIEQLCAVEGEGIGGVICGRSIYSGALDFAAGQSSLAFALGPRLGCASDAPLQVFRIDGRPPAVETHLAELGTELTHGRFYRARDGYTYAHFGGPRAEVVLHHFDRFARPAPLSEPLSDGEPGYRVHDITAFREGHAWLASDPLRRGDAHDDTVRVVVGDATHRTRSPKLGATSYSNASGSTVLVGGEGEGSILVALGVPEGIALARADCVPGG